MGATAWDSTLQRPATAAGGVRMRDVTVGTLTSAFDTNGARRDEYIDSQKRIAKAAADAGVTVIVGENQPFVAGAEGRAALFSRMNAGSFRKTRRRDPTANHEPISRSCPSSSIT